MLPLFEPPPDELASAARLDAALLRKDSERLARNLPSALLVALSCWHRDPSPEAGAALRAALHPHAPALRERLETLRKDST